MNEKSSAIPRTVLTDFCQALGYSPNDVITIEATSKTVSVTTRPRGVTGIEGITTVHQIIEGEA